MSTTFSTPGIRPIAAANQDSAADAFDNEDDVAGLLIQERSGRDGPLAHDR